jgi:hypothetical protein
VGWRPMAPRIRDHRHGEPGRDYHHGSGTLVRDHRHPQQHDANWRFATVSDFARPHIRSHLYRNPAEGLRVTSTVAAPPLRARTTVHAGDLMRSRFSGGRSIQPGYGGPQQIRDHRSSEPVRAYQPAQGDRPARYQPYNPPARTYQPSVRSYNPPARSFQPPPRSYNPPARSYNPPARTNQPSVRSYNPPARTFQPPPRSYNPPARTYQPPARTVTPHAPSPAPSRSSSPPPARSGSSHTSGGGSSHAGGGGRHR